MTGTLARTRRSARNRLSCCRARPAAPWSSSHRWPLRFSQPMRTARSGSRFRDKRLRVRQAHGPSTTIRASGATRATPRGNTLRVLPSRGSHGGHLDFPNCLVRGMLRRYSTAASPTPAARPESLLRFARATSRIQRHFGSDGVHEPMPRPWPSAAHPVG